MHYQVRRYCRSYVEDVDDVVCTGKVGQVDATREIVQDILLSSIKSMWKMCKMLKYALLTELTNKEDTMRKT